MTPLLALVMPYYKNPTMLAHQYGVWAAYPDDLKAQIEVVLVDDGSPLPAVDVPRPEGLPALRIYRVLVDKPWHQHGARNLGAHEAAAPWLFLTDMDHILPATSLAALMPKLNYEVVYTFHRVDAPNGTPTRNERGQLKPHVNTFAMSKAHFWAVGGYDEDCLGYGTDSYFRTRLKAHSTMVHLYDIPIVRVPREVVPDASSFQPGMDPRAFRNAGRKTEETRRRMAKKAAKKAPPKVLDFPWERVL
jgi:hypothetical protein